MRQLKSQYLNALSQMFLFLGLMGFSQFTNATLDFAVQNLKSDGWDIVLLVDESASMGTETLDGSRSDKKGRRVKAVSMFAKALWHESESQSRVKNKQLDFRLSVIRFGTKPVLLSDWQVISHSMKKPNYDGFVAANLGWTNFKSAFEMASTQFSRINYGRHDGITPRKLAFVVLTDGEPSTPENKLTREFLWRQPGFWQSLNNSGIAQVRSHYPEAPIYLVTFKDPNKDYWPHVESGWAMLGAERMEVIELVDNVEDGLYYVIQHVLMKKFSDIVQNSIANEGIYEVPCFQERIDFNVTFANRPYAIELLDPNNNRIDGAAQPNAKVDATFMSFSINNPTPGQWKILNFKSGAYKIDYHTVPLKVTYKNPPSNTTFFNKADKISFSLSRENGRITQLEREKCTPQGAVELNEVGGRQLKLPLKFDVTDNEIIATTYKDYLPAKDVNEVDMTLVVEGENGGKLMLKTTNKLGVTKKKRAKVDVTSDSALSFNGDQAITQISMQFVDEDTGLAIPLDELFANPDDAVTIEIICQDANCPAPADSTGFSQATKWSITGPLKMSADKLSLGAKVTFDFVPVEQIESNWWQGTLRRLFGQGGRVRVRLAMNGKAQMPSDYLIVQPDSQ